MDLGIKNRVALVTGGASGIGRAVVQELAENGCKVFSRLEKRLQVMNLMIIKNMITYPRCWLLMLHLMTVQN